MVIDIKDYPVMKRKCTTCPFRTDERGRHADPRLVSRIQKQVLSEASQICLVTIHDCQVRKKRIYVVVRVTINYRYLHAWVF